MDGDGEVVEPLEVHIVVEVDERIAQTQAGPRSEAAATFDVPGGDGVVPRHDGVLVYEGLAAVGGAQIVGVERVEAGVGCSEGHGTAEHLGARHCLGGARARAAGGHDVPGGAEPRCSSRYIRVKCDCDGVAGAGVFTR